MERQSMKKKEKLRWNGEREHEKERKTDNIGYADAVYLLNHLTVM